LKIAIVHEWFVSYAGSERVVEQIIRLYPKADLYSLIDFIPETERGFLLNKKVITSFIQHLPMARTDYRGYLVLMPFAIKQFDLSDYNLIISSSHATAKGIRKTPQQLHICYCHTPMRYVWDLQHLYIQAKGLDRVIISNIAVSFFSALRRWDISTSKGVDHFVCNSHYIRDRIRRAYGRDAEVIYPPVDTENFKVTDKKDDYFITVSRLVPYKRVDVIVEAFARTDLPLIVVGEGPESKKIKRLARRNIEFIGYLRDDILRMYTQRARAFVYAAEEDFGIAPVEAQACGTPVIAFGKGGVTETVIPLKTTDNRLQTTDRIFPHPKPAIPDSHPTGIFFYEQTPEALMNAVKEFMAIEDRFNPHDIRKNAERFSIERFRREFKEFVDKKIKEFFTS
jgi:glycosyltransferase involved in cell wall biosynthesis